MTQLCFQILKTIFLICRKTICLVVKKGGIERCIGDFDSSDIDFNDALTKIMVEFQTYETDEETPKIQGQSLIGSALVPLSSDEELNKFIKTYTEKGRSMIPMHFEMVEDNGNNLNPQDENEDAMKK